MIRFVTVKENKILAFDREKDRYSAEGRLLADLSFHFIFSFFHFFIFFIFSFFHFFHFSLFIFRFFHFFFSSIYVSLKFFVFLFTAEGSSTAKKPRNQWSQPRKTSFRWYFISRQKPRPQIPPRSKYKFSSSVSWNTCVWLELPLGFIIFDASPNYDEN